MKTFFISCLTMCCQLAAAQVQQGQLYLVNGGIQGQLDVNGTCSATLYDICPASRIKVMGFENGDTNGNIIVRVVYAGMCVNNQGNNPAVKNVIINPRLYCVDKGLFSTIRGELTLITQLPKPVWAYGVFSIPIKVQYSSFEFYPAGEIGGAFGGQFPISKAQPDLSIDLLLCAGITAIPLNDTTAAATNTKTVPGGTFAGALVFNIPKNFQAGVSTGIDIYSNVTARTRPWFSFGIGYNFGPAPQTAKPPGTPAPATMRNFALH